MLDAVEQIFELGTNESVTSVGCIYMKPHAWELVADHPNLWKIIKGATWSGSKGGRHEKWYQTHGFIFFHCLQQRILPKINNEVLNLLINQIANTPYKLYGEEVSWTCTCCTITVFSLLLTISKVFPLNDDVSSGSKILSFTKQIIAAFSTHEWASFEQYAISFESSTPSSTNGCCCFSRFRAWARAASIDTKTHSLAEVCKVICASEKQRKWE